MADSHGFRSNVFILSLQIQIKYNRGSEKTHKFIDDVDRFTSSDVLLVYSKSLSALSVNPRNSDSLLSLYSLSSDFGTHKLRYYHIS